MSDEHKACRKCKQEKPINDFYVIRKTDGRRDWCRSCVIANVAEWQRSNPKKHYEKQRRSDLKRRYGLSEQDLARLFAEQNGTCAICGVEARPEAGLKVDHCHASGRVRGLLCDLCNTALGMFEDDTDRLRRAAAYLDR